LVTFEGASAALIGAFLWAFSAILFEQLTDQISPSILNILKGATAIVFLSLTSVILGETGFQPFSKQGAILFASGILGIGIGDTAYFQSVKMIGARRALLLFTLSPPITALIALVWLGEKLTFMAWLGIIITVIGVMWVVTEEDTSKSKNNRTKSLASGVGFGVIAALGQAVGLVLSRSVMTGSGMTALQSAGLRLAAGITFILGYRIVKDRKNVISKVSGLNRNTMGLIVLSAFLGTYICLWLQQIAISNLSAGIAQTILSTSPVFILPIAGFRGEKISLRAIVGACISILGVTFVFGLIG